MSRKSLQEESFPGESAGNIAGVPLTARMAMDDITGPGIGEVFCHCEGMITGREKSEAPGSVAGESPSANPCSAAAPLRRCPRHLSPPITHM